MSGRLSKADLASASQSDDPLALLRIIQSKYKQSQATKIDSYDWETKVNPEARGKIQGVLVKIKGYSSGRFNKYKALDNFHQFDALSEFLRKSTDKEEIKKVVKVLNENRVSFKEVGKGMNFFQIPGEVPISDIDIQPNPATGGHTLHTTPDPRYTGMVKHADPRKDVHVNDEDVFREHYDYLKLMKSEYPDLFSSLDLTRFEKVQKPTHDDLDSIGVLISDVNEVIAQRTKTPERTHEENVREVFPEGGSESDDDGKFKSTRGSPNPTPAPEGHKTPPKNAWGGRGKDESINDFAKRWIQENVTEKDDYRTKLDEFIQVAGDDDESGVAFDTAFREVNEAHSPKLTIDDQGEDVNPKQEVVKPVLAPAAAAPVAAPAVSFAQKIENILESHASSAAHVVSPQTLKELETLEARQGHVDIELRQELGLNAASGDKPLDAYERVLKDEQPTLKQAMYGRSFNIHYKSRHIDIKKILEANKLRPKRSQHPEIQYKYHRPDWKNLLYVDPLLAWTM
jgi:hypothetical protein